MALTSIAPPGQKESKPSALQNAASVMGILGSLGNLYENIKKPQSLETSLEDYVKKALSKESQEQTMKASQMFQKMYDNQRFPWTNSSLSSVSRSGS